MRACALLVCLGLLAACGPEQPREVSLADLAFAMAEHDGALVETVGVVRAFTEAEDDALRDHFVIEDDAQNRVELVPHDAVAGYVGEQVRVVGRFTVDDGRLLEVDAITPEERPADLAR